MEAGGSPPERLHVDGMMDIAAGNNGRKLSMSGGLTAVKKNGMISVIPTGNRKFTICSEER
jgi:hypothetical protein